MIAGHPKRRKRVQRAPSPTPPAEAEAEAAPISHAAESFEAGAPADEVAGTTSTHVRPGDRRPEEPSDEPPSTDRLEGNL